ncbi:MAG: hypothetical protein IJ604_09265 [Prevotella sp.]|nr:hypothetical protein [Prevotella sp.]
MEKKLYTAPCTELIRVQTEAGIANMNPLSETNIENKGEGDNREAGSIGLDNSGDFGDITPAKRSSLWDDDEEDGY